MAEPAVAEPLPGALALTAAYDYELPERLIAKVPADPADASRLLVVGQAGDEHRTFLDFPGRLRAGDVLVVNETRVVRARLHGTRELGGGRAEVLLLRPAAGGPFSYDARAWRALVRPGRKLPRGATVRFGRDGVAEVVEAHGDGARTVRLDLRLGLEELLERYGELPLPPYVGPGNEARSARYQTLFARVPGSVAAPTASLHFTPRVLASLAVRGVTLAPLVLDVGLGTFKPMAGRTLAEHTMHEESYAVPAATAAAVNAAKREGRRVVAAGTTVLRALEASAAPSGIVVPGERETSLFIRPDFPFRIVDALLTNFHLPRSTLLVLATAFGGYGRVMEAYRTAIAAEYRFYSFGDAMFLTNPHGATSDIGLRPN